MDGSRSLAPGRVGVRQALAIVSAVTACILVPPSSPAHAAALHRGVSVWLPSWSMSAATASTLNNASVIGTASPFWYQMQGDATLHSASGAGDTTLISKLHGKGIRVVPTITESQSGTDFGAMGTTSSRRAAHVAALVRLVRSRAYDGLDLDYEVLAVNLNHNSAVADRAEKAYSLVARDTCHALHQLHKSCVLTVMARTTDSHVYFRSRYATWVFDYPTLNGYADKIRIMAYGEHAPSSAPGPIGSIVWTKNIINYAKSRLTTGKVVLALPAYGQDWSSSGCTALTSRGAVARASAYGVRPVYNSSAHEMTYRYTHSGIAHTVWFGDTTSINERTTLARRAGFTLAFWAAGFEQSSLWPKLRTQFTY